MHKPIIVLSLAAVALLACRPDSGPATDRSVSRSEDAFQVSVDRFADIQVLRYPVPGFDELSLQQKKLAYYLAQAALSGRDIIYDQNYSHNLRIRKTLAAVVETFAGDHTDAAYTELLTYAKRVWFANGIHHHYSSRKMEPGFSAAEFAELVRSSDPSHLPLREGESADDLIRLLEPILFDPGVASKMVSLDASTDLLAASATHFYDGVTQAEAEAYYAARIDPAEERPISWGLNSQMVKVGNEVVERVWRVGGMYGPALEQIVHWLEKAAGVAENEAQRAWIEKLIDYYRSGHLGTYDEYNIAWVKDTDSRVDTINGFTEVYDDPLGYRGSWEAVVSIRDLEASRRIATLAENAQWFEDHSPILQQHKKAEVVGISAKVITVVTEGGDAAPSTPIGINLPNSNWIRKEYGSKSVTLGNVIESLERASAESGLQQEFMLTDEEKARYAEYGALAYPLGVDLHEVIGHASGQLEPGTGTPKETLKSYASTLEEARADLVALYFELDPKLVELGLLPSLEAGKAEYDRTIRNGLLMQLRRLQPGEDIEEAHMRNRQLVARWALEKGAPDGVIERVVENGQTYFVVRDYEGLRQLFGQLLREIQRIKSQGDYEAGRDLVERFGVKVDAELHAEVLARVEPLDIAPYSGFVQPRLVPIEKDGEIVDVQVELPDDYVAQMLEYEHRYSFLPVDN